MSSEAARELLPVKPRSGPDYETGCDFFCLRFQVWYPSADCAYRTRYRTYDGCWNCDQGRFNLKRHAGAASLPIVAAGSK